MCSNPSSATKKTTALEKGLFYYFAILIKTIYYCAMKRLESQEDYLEKILQISLEKDKVHAIDIAHGLSYSKPSVSIAMTKLKEQGLININDKDEITLTPAGLEIASKTLEKHNAIAELLMRLGVSEQTAREDACKMEHDISDETWEAIKSHVNYFKK